MQTTGCDVDEHGRHLVRRTDRVDVAADRLQGGAEQLGLGSLAERDDAELHRPAGVLRGLEFRGQFLGGDGVGVVLVATVGEDEHLVGHAGAVGVPGGEIRSEDRVVEAGAGLLHRQPVDRGVQRLPVRLVQGRRGQQYPVVAVAVELHAELPQAQSRVVGQQRAQRSAALPDGSKAR